MESIIKDYAQYMSLFVLYLVLEIIKAAKKWKEERKTEAKSDPNALMRKKNEIENYCHVILAETKASHVAVWRFHNGHFYSGGDSMKSISMFTEAALTDGLHVDVMSQNLPLKNYSKTFTALTENTFLVVERDQAPDWHLNQLLNQRKYAHMVLCMLRGPEGVPLGTLEISFLLEDINWKSITSVMIDRYKKELEYKLA